MSMASAAAPAHARLAHDERRAPAGHRARGVARGARLVRPQAQQLGQPQRVADLAHARSRHGHLQRRERPGRQDRRIRHLVDDRQVAVEAVADQHRVVALDDHARDPVAALARGAQVGGGVLEVLVQHDRQHGLRARVAVQLREPAQAPAGGSGPGRRLADRAHHGVAREVQLLEPPELDQAGVDGVELGEQQAVHGLAQPPLGARDELADPRGAGGRALRSRRLGAPHAQEVGCAAGHEAGDGELRRGVADIDASDQHQSLTA